MLDSLIMLAVSLFDEYNFSRLDCLLFLSCFENSFAFVLYSSVKYKQPPATFVVPAFFYVRWEEYKLD